jgi:catechol 2,3-dioxygenase-like lactoylglutathione lyase family enzyme
MEIKLISSVLFVKDIAESRKFYEDVLNQTVLMDHGPNVGFNGGFAIWQQDHAGQMVFGSGKMAESAPKKNAAELYFETEELDEAVKKLDDKRVEFIHPLQEQPWGQRVTRFYDPDGHILELGEPMDCVIKRFHTQGLSPVEIAQRTFMPVEIVNQIVAAIK